MPRVAASRRVGAVVSGRSNWDYGPELPIMEFAELSITELGSNERVELILQTKDWAQYYGYANEEER